MEADQLTLRTLKKLGIDAEWKMTSSFQLHLKQGNVMLYTGWKKGTFIYVPWTNKKIRLSDSLKGLLKAIEKIKPKEVEKKEVCMFCGNYGWVSGEGNTKVPCASVNPCALSI
jgi:hypothetical protein